MYLTNDLVTSVKARAHVPTSQNTFQQADFYRFGDEELRSKLLPLILANMEEYYVYDVDYTIVAGQSSYAIPARAIAGKLRDVQIVNPTNDDDRYSLPRLNPEDLYTGSAAWFSVSQKAGFYPKGNSIILYPAPKGIVGKTLRLSIYIRPSQFVDVSACALIQSISTVAKTVTVAALPSTFSTTAAVDFVKAQPGFENPAIDQTITNIAGTILTFASVPSSLSVGDYVCLAGQSCVVQCPVELQPLLAQYVVIRTLEAQKDASGLKQAGSELKQLQDNANLLLSPRIDGKPKRVTSGRRITRFV